LTSKWLMRCLKKRKKSEGVDLEPKNVKGAESSPNRTFLIEEATPLVQAFSGANPTGVGDRRGLSPHSLQTTKVQ